MAGSAYVATPHPSSPARGEVTLLLGLTPSNTLPLAGRDGEGVGHKVGTLHA